jgi:hypothetical protein
MRTTLSFLLLLAILSGCRKPSEFAPEYIGTWTVAGGCAIGQLVIYDDNTGCFDENIDYDREGPCRWASCGKIRIGAVYLYVANTGFKIVEKPHLVNTPVNNYSGYWEMIIKWAGQTLTCRRYIY